MAAGFIIIGLVAGLAGALLSTAGFGASVWVAALVFVVAGVSAVLAAAVPFALVEWGRTPDGGGDGRAVRHGSPAPAGEDAIFRNYGQRFRAMGRRSGVGLLVCGTGHDGAGEVPRLRSCGGGEAMVAHDCAIALDWIEGNEGFFGHVVVDEAYVGAAACRGFCETLRERAPDLAVIVLTAEAAPGQAPRGRDGIIEFPRNRTAGKGAAATRPRDGGGTVPA